MDLDALFPGRPRETFPPSRDDVPLASFSIVRVEPVAGQPWIYLTQGASEHGSEFVLFSRRPFEGHLDLLTSVAYFQSFYGLPAGAIYKYARGYFPNSTLNRLFVSTRPPFENAPGYAWLVPITDDEEKLAKKQGAAALEALLGGVDWLAEDRPSVA